jgi:multidrug efflux pump subunit AcrA (membrane-fusion protein)
MPADESWHSGCTVLIELLLPKRSLDLHSRGKDMMFETNSQPVRSGGVMKIMLPVIGGIVVAVLLLVLYDLHGTVARIDAAQAGAASSLKDINERLETEDSTMRAATSALAEKIGMTEKHLRQRTAELRREQASYEARLKQEQSEQIEGVKREHREQIEGVRTDVAATRTDLEATKQKLEHTIGDLGVQSGLIAHTREDLEQLKRRGDRNYYEFTLAKAKRPTRVSNISMQLKRVNPKRGKFTLDVTADDFTIEKRDRTLFEPMQFYTGRDRQLYEVVVFSADKNKISGYLSTPKSVASTSQGQ